MNASKIHAMFKPWFKKYQSHIAASVWNFQPFHNGYKVDEFLGHDFSFRASKNSGDQGDIDKLVLHCHSLKEMACFIGSFNEAGGVKKATLCILFNAVLFQSGLRQPACPSLKMAQSVDQ